MWHILCLYFAYTENIEFKIILIADNNNTKKRFAPTMMVNMQIREQLQWIVNNFNLQVTKTSAAM